MILFWNIEYKMVGWQENDELGRIFKEVVIV
jgi:hypothetical protein